MFLLLWGCFISTAQELALADLSVEREINAIEFLQSRKITKVHAIVTRVLSDTATNKQELNYSVEIISKNAVVVRFLQTVPGYGRYERTKLYSFEDGNFISLVDSTFECNMQSDCDTALHRIHLTESPTTKGLFHFNSSTGTTMNESAFNESSDTFRCARDVEELTPRRQFRIMPLLKNRSVDSLHRYIYGLSPMNIEAIEFNGKELLYLSHRYLEKATRTTKRENDSVFVLTISQGPYGDGSFTTDVVRFYISNEGLSARTKFISNNRLENTIDYEYE